MLKNFILTLFICSISFPIFSQSDTLFTKAFFPDQQKKLHDAIQAIKVGDNWDKKYNNYDSALFYYEKASQLTSNNHEINEKIASIYLRSGFYAKADSFARKSYQLKPTLKNRFINGRTNHLLYNDELAIKFYREYISHYDSISVPTDKEVEILLLQAKNIASSQREEYFVYHPDSLNSTLDDYSPLYLPNSDQLFYTSEKYSSNNLDFSSANIYFSTYKDSIFSEGQIINNRSINIKGNSAISSISKSGKTMVFYQGFENGRLFYSKIDQTKEIKVPNNKQKLPSPINSFFNEVIGGTFTPDGKEFYFSSKRKEGKGGFDIYYTKREGKKWIDAILVKNINSSFNEIDPYFSNNGDTLFFASDNEKSIGGYDIFFSIKKQGNEWSTPYTLPFPINSTFDDRTPSTNESGSQFLVSSNRIPTKGGLDIFIIDRATTSSQEVVAEEIVTVKEDTSHLELARIFDEHLVNIQFYTFNKGDSSIIDDASVNIYSIPDNILIDQVSTDSTGIATIKGLPKNQTVGINIIKKGFDLFSLNAIIDQPDSLYKVGLDKIEVNHSVTLYNVFFDFNSSKIQSSSQTELENLLVFLNINPEVSIQIEGHTDNVGDEDINQILSQNRADEIKAYLIENGIGKKRITSIGFGETKPISDNSTKEGKAFNRRTEFKIIKN